MDNPARRPLYKGIIVVVAGAIAAYLLINFKTSLKPLAIAPVAPTPESTETTETDVDAEPLIDGSAPKLTSFDTKDYQLCGQFNDNYRDIGWSWARENHGSWGRYLDLGYSLNEITLAVAFFLNSNFAVSFRDAQLKKDTALSKNNQTLMEEFERDFPELVRAGVKVEQKIPLASLSNFTNLSGEDKRELLKSEPISVNDVAYFILDNKASDKDILTLLSSIESPNATVSFKGLEATSLLDFAVAESRLSVVEELLRMGASPTEDAYLGSTMEWAISKLGYAYFANEEKRENAAKIVLILKDMDAAARFSEQSPNKVSGGFPRHYYDFNQEKLLELDNLYGLDLTEIHSRDALEIDEENALIQELVQARDAHIEDALNEPGAQFIFSECDETLKYINAMWKPKPSGVLINQVLAIHDGDRKAIELALGDIDPMLVDIYREQLKINTEWVDGLDTIIEPLRNGKIDDVIDSLNELELTVGQKNWVSLQILGWKPSYYEKLVSAGITSQEIQYYNYSVFSMLRESTLKQLQIAGADLHNADIRGKTLLYYATKKADLKLVQYMAEARIPFDLTNIGEDPLHAALNASDYRFSVQNANAMIETLMNYKPEIDQFHLSRMALIRLKYPTLYKEIVETHPELETPEDMPLLEVR